MFQRRRVPNFAQIYNKEWDDAGCCKLGDKAVYGQSFICRKRTGVAAVGKEVQAGCQKKEHQTAECILLRYKKRVQEHPEKANGCR